MDVVYIYVILSQVLRELAYFVVIFSAFSLGQEAGGKRCA